MPGSTSRLGLALPLTGDAATEYRTAITTNANDLDGAVVATSGVLASRPSSGLVFDQEYYATDTGQWFKYNGSAWVQIAVCDAAVPGNLTLPGTLTVDGAATVDGALTASDGLTVSNGATVSGGLAVNQNAQFNNLIRFASQPGFQIDRGATSENFGPGLTSASISFNFTFGSIPIVVATIGLSPSYYGQNPGPTLISTISTTGFTVYFSLNETLPAVVYWVALG